MNMTMINKDNVSWWWPWIGRPVDPHMSLLGSLSHLKISFNVWCFLIFIGKRRLVDYDSNLIPIIVPGDDDCENVEKISPNQCLCSACCGTSWCQNQPCSSQLCHSLKIACRCGDDEKAAYDDDDDDDDDEDDGLFVVFSICIVT